MNRIVCAAIRAEDDDVLIGIRHYSMDMHAQIKARTDGAKFYHRSGDDQGFVDKMGNYHDRHDAWLIALKANQIVRVISYDKQGVLYSENLY